MATQSHDTSFLMDAGVTGTSPNSQQHTILLPSGPAEPTIPKDSSNFCRNDLSTALFLPTNDPKEADLGCFTETGTAKRLFPAEQGTPGQSPLFLPSDLPSAESTVFKDSAFFRRNGSTSVLPSPADVLAEAYRRRGVVNDYNPPPMHYPSLGLTVKYGRTISTADGQCLWAVGQSLGNVIPVPEVYGWTVEAGVSYIYMEHIPGETLQDRWGSLSESEKRDICSQMGRNLSVSRKAPIAQVNKLTVLLPLLGSVSRQRLRDYTFASSPPMGPFTSVAEFNDRFAKLPWLSHGPNDPPHPFRVHLPDDVPVIFTHGDLHRGNIIISSAKEGGSPRVKAIIDWGQSGWYPSYWEYCKAQLTANWTEDWCMVYIPLFLDAAACYSHWDYFLLCMGE